MEQIPLTSLVALAARWDFSPNAATYLGPQERTFAPFGVAISGQSMRSGNHPSYGRLSQATVSWSRIVFGHSARTAEYFSAEIGGYGFGYLLDEYIPNTGWRGLRTEGSENNLKPETLQQVEVHLRGQRVALFVNAVRVLEGDLPHPLVDDRIGLFAFGDAPVQFTDFQVETGRPQAFVVMQYSPPYDVLFSDVIEPVAREAGFIAYRAADVYRPGLALEDVMRGLAESELIAAEITPPNQNVFYELGYAHALEKPTMLLAEKTQRDELPFDIRGHRVIVYDNTIGGKKEVSEHLRRHLLTIKGAGGLNRK